MAEPKPPTTVELIWERELVFSGKSGTTELTLDSASTAGPSPMQLVGYGLAGCMAMDVVVILTKGRHPLKGLRVDLTGMRAESEPRRFTAIEIHYTVNGSVPEEAVQRAIDLSRDKYCSVWHSMRPDIELKVTFSITPE
jgi:putative redox protein